VYPAVKASALPLKESIKKNDVFEKVKIDKIYKDDLKNQEMVVKQQLSKSIKNDISFEKKLHNNILHLSYECHHFIYRTIFNKSTVCIFYFYILSCEFKARLFYFYGTHGLSFSTFSYQKQVV
jgi:hypothetical protein